MFLSCFHSFSVAVAAFFQGKQTKFRASSGSRRFARVTRRFSLLWSLWSRSCSNVVDSCSLDIDTILTNVGFIFYTFSLKHENQRYVYWWRIAASGWFFLSICGCVCRTIGFFFHRPRCFKVVLEFTRTHSLAESFELKTKTTRV